jgi:flagellar biosynthesis/type III secretory pathway M-ring protein FliF/YscJ
MKTNFTSSKPSLVSDDMIRNIKTLSINEDVPNITPIDWTDSLNSFYYVFIKPNIFGIILVLIILIFLAYKYFNKKREQKHKKKNKEVERPKEKMEELEKINVQTSTDKDFNIDENDNTENIIE